MTQKIKDILNSYEVRKDKWVFADLERDLKKAPGINSYHDVKVVIIEADRMGSWPNAVRQYLTSNYNMMGNVPSELEVVARRVLLGMGKKLPFVRVIGVAGCGNSGKSHVLRWVIELLKARASGVPVPNAISMTPYDVQAWFVYKKLKIAICTGGDTVAVIKNNISFFRNMARTKGLDIAISAAKLYGQTHVTLDAYAKPGRVEWYQKAYMHNGPITLDAFWKREAELIIDTYL